MWITGIVVCFGWLFSLCFHEFSHALVAYLGGDKTIKNKGYLTFNLFKYTQAGSSLILPLVFILIGGIALPGGAVYVNHSLLRDRYWSSLVSAAGPISNILFALLLLIPFKLFNNDLNFDSIFNDFSYINLFFSSLAYLIYLQVFATLFNSIPIPPFDGYGTIEPWLPINIKAKMNQYGNYGYFLILGLFFFVPRFSSFFFNLLRGICNFLGVPELLVVRGQILFYHPINKAIAIIIIVIIGYMLRFNENTWYQKGSSLRRRGNSEKAISAYKKAIKIKPDYADAWLQKAHSLFDLKRYQEALESYQQVIKLEPKHHNAWVNLGHVYSNLENYEKAIAAYQKAIALNNDAQNDSSFKYLSDLLFYLDRKEEAIDLLDRGLNLTPKSQDLWLTKARYLYKLEKYRATIETCNRGLEIAPKSTQLKYYLALALHKLKKSSAAKDIFSKILAIDSQDILALSGQADIYYSEQNYTAAINNYQKIIEAQPENSPAWYNQACCYALQKKSIKAIAALRKAIELDPSNQELAKNDKDFICLQSDRDFQALITTSN